MKHSSKKTLLNVVICQLFLFSISLNSQTLADNSRLDLFYDDVQNSAQGAFHVFTNPVRWERSDWLCFGGVIAGGALLFTIDSEVDHLIKRNRHSSMNKLADFGSSFGNPVTVVALTGAIYSYGILFKNEWARETAVIFTSSLIAGGLVQTASKKIAGRARPYMNLGENHFRPFPSTDNFHSFVSGHTLVSVSTALILAKRVNNNYLKSIFYTLGGIGAWARMYQQNHFSSDVFLGAALSYSTVMAAINWQDSSKVKESKKTDYSVNFNMQKIDLAIYF